MRLASALILPARLALLVLAVEMRMPAQCAMCRSAAAAQGASGTLNAAILILLLPALVLFSAVFLMAFRCPDPPDSDDDIHDDLPG
jgi:hypothetical protein